MTNVYINNRNANIIVNRRVINRTVNVANLNRFSSVHRNVTYNNVAFTKLCLASLFCGCQCQEWRSCSRF